MADIEEKPAVLTDDPAVWVHLRNEFYKSKYRFVLALCVLSFVVICILLTMVIYLVRHPPNPVYFATDKLSRLIQEVPLSIPNMSIQDVENWTVEGLQAAYSYDFMNYRSQLQHSQKYFTEFGWRNYMKGLVDSNNLVAVKDRNMVVIAQAVGPPKIITQGLLSGAYAWKFEIPFLLTYMLPPFDSKSTFQNPLVITVIVQRQPILQSDKGLGIVQTIGNLVLSPNSQAISPAASS